MLSPQKYSLNNFKEIIHSGFTFVLPDELMLKITRLTNDTVNLNINMGKADLKPVILKTHIFNSKEIIQPPLLNAQTNVPTNAHVKKIRNKMNVELTKPFQSTKLEEKKGIDVKIDIVRSYLNKLTDKNYFDMRNQIVEVINNIIIDNNENLLKLGITIFEIATSNRFFSKLYADLYSDLILNFDIMSEIFNDSFNKFISLFDNIEYIDPNLDYDKFCKVNKDNEKRRSLATFFMNLMKNNVISKKEIIIILRNLMNQFYTYINIENKKNEVDELAENIFILYSTELFNNTDEYELIDGNTIPELVSIIAQSSAKTYLSLTNKSIFKFMDLIEM